MSPGVTVKIFITNFCCHFYSGRLDPSRPKLLQVTYDAAVTNGSKIRIAGLKGSQQSSVSPIAKAWLWQRPNRPHGAGATLPTPRFERGGFLKRFNRSLALALEIGQL